MTAIAERAAERAPAAWFVNYTNPAGLVTEALGDVLGERVFGICDSPVELAAGVARALGREPSELRLDSDLPASLPANQPARPADERRFAGPS